MRLPATAADLTTGQPGPPPPVFVGRLSDEELALLDAEHPCVQLPYLGELDPAQRAAALRAASRALMARGFGLDPAARHVQMPQAMSDALDVRAGAERVLVVQYEFLGEPDGPPLVGEIYAFSVEDFILIEQVSSAGMHDFWAADQGQLAAFVCECLPATSAPDGQGEPFRLDLAALAEGSESQVQRRLGQELGHVDAVVWQPDATPDPLIQTVIFTTSGCFAVREVYASTGPVQLWPVRRSHVGLIVLGLLHRADDGRE